MRHCPEGKSQDQRGAKSEELSRHDFFCSATVAGAASLVSGNVIAQNDYAAKVWVNGSVVAEHLGGHLPFAAEVSNQLVWDRKNLISISMENKQLIERVPPGPGTGGGVAGVLGGYPATTYDFFPYAGLHRPVHRRYQRLHSEESSLVSKEG